MTADRLPGFLEPMECRPVDDLPSGPEWTYEIKLDGWRCQAVRGREGARLLSKTGKPLEGFPEIEAQLAALAPGTSLDGELAAHGPDGRPSFNLLQNHRSRRGGAQVFYYPFDMLFLKGRDLTRLPLAERRALLEKALGALGPRSAVRQSLAIASRATMEAFVRERGLEGVVAKRADSRYQPGLRTGQWVKRRMHPGQEFVVGGFVPSHLGVDQVAVGYYREGSLVYAGRVRAGFRPETRLSAFERLKGLVVPKCPFDAVGGAGSGRCLWVRPEAVAQFEFQEWTPGGRLRQPKFLGFRDDKNPFEVVKES